jgi:hypothetical protein
MCQQSASSSSRIYSILMCLSNGGAGVFTNLWHHHKFLFGKLGSKDDTQHTNINIKTKTDDREAMAQQNGEIGQLRKGGRGGNGSHKKADIGGMGRRWAQIVRGRIGLGQLADE